MCAAQRPDRADAADDVPVPQVSRLGDFEPFAERVRGEAFLGKLTLAEEYQLEGNFMPPEHQTDRQRFT